MAAPVGSVEVFLEYGFDLQLDPATADLVLAKDVAGSPVATTQRLGRGMRTNPRPRDLNQNAIGVPDDLLHPDYGMGLGASVGEANSPQLANGMKARGKKMLAEDGFISQSPLPTVTTSQIGAQLTVSVSAMTVLGEPVGLTLPLSNGE